MEQLFKFICISFALFITVINPALSQEDYKYERNRYDDLISTNDPNTESRGEVSGIDPYPVKWIPYETSCRSCRDLAKQYNETMQDLFNAYSMMKALEDLRDIYNKHRRPIPENQTDEQAAQALQTAMEMAELFNESLPVLQQNYDQLKLTAQSLKRALDACELSKCKPKGGEQPKTEISIPGGEIIKTPDLFIDWKGPYFEVCKDCRKQAEKLNEFYQKALDNVNVVNALRTRVAFLKAQLILSRDFFGDILLNRLAMEKAAREQGTKRDQTVYEAEQDKEDLKRERDKIEKISKELRNAEKDLEKALKERDKIKTDFDKAVKDRDDCIAKKCPPQKNACTFPEQDYESIIIGPNDEVGSSAQAAKEMRDRVTGAAKGAATKAIGNLIGFGGFGGGGPKGPKTDKDRTRGDFSRISAGDTNLDIRAGWHDDQLIVSTDIADSPDDGTFHAQWLEDKDGNIFLPTRYLIFEMYRDWKLTVSWTEDHYVDGEHVFHDEGQEITTGRDHLGTWTLFEGENAKLNSIWAMLGFDTATKGVKHLGAVYDIPMSDFPDDCQLQLVTHVSDPSKETVGTLPVLANLFKHEDTRRKRPETVILVQPTIIEPGEE
ncbi:hypothetical protein [Pseudemcibacter aquimaris]|uniref:hypothetical protein n=1 Tax=Pseudemcibacter aquimaris TaxID=2857064 RepID=UPI002013503D|nr:hypothetical protein [Pseudemcibacter aquimaris]MCC3860187.1 hypothetical protein [Pseudemcibacter aquimaris]WDU57513.1 hypothetical protein KW060_09930 [Pseudemcibacter aquimaris]